VIIDQRYPEIIQEDVKLHRKIILEDAKMSKFTKNLHRHTSNGEQAIFLKV